MGWHLPPAHCFGPFQRSEEHTSELQSRLHLVCRLLLEKKKNKHDFRIDDLIIHCPTVESDAHRHRLLPLLDRHRGPPHIDFPLVSSSLTNNTVTTVCGIPHVPVCRSRVKSTSTQMFV